jgi:hypothetical protein
MQNYKTIVIGDYNFPLEKGGQSSFSGILTSKASNILYIPLEQDAINNDSQLCNTHTS